MSIPFISSIIVETCSQILLQTSFAGLCSLPVCCRKTASPAPLLMLFSVLVSISVHLSWPGISSVGVGIPASIFVAQLKHCQFLLEIPLWGSYLPFHGYVAFECIVSPWLAQAFHLLPPSHCFQGFSPEQPWMGLRKCFGSIFALVAFSFLLRHLPPSLLSTAEGPAGSSHVCVFSSRNYFVSWCAWDILTVSGKMALVLVEVVLEGWGSVHPQEICFTFEFLHKG